MEMTWKVPVPRKVDAQVRGRVGVKADQPWTGSRYPGRDGELSPVQRIQYGEVPYRSVGGEGPAW